MKTTIINITLIALLILSAACTSPSPAKNLAEEQKKMEDQARLDADRQAVEQEKARLEAEKKALDDAKMKAEEDQRMRDEAAQKAEDERLAQIESARQKIAAANVSQKPAIQPTLPKNASSEGPRVKSFRVLKVDPETEVQKIGSDFIVPSDIPHVVEFTLYPYQKPMVFTVTPDLFLSYGTDDRNARFYYGDKNRFQHMGSSQVFTMYVSNPRSDDTYRFYFGMPCQFGKEAHIALNVKDARVGYGGDEFTLPIQIIDRTRSIIVT